jgi:hypothetical protein
MLQLVAAGLLILGVVALSLVARAYTKGRLKEEIVEAEGSAKPAHPTDDFADEEVREKST